MRVDGMEVEFSGNQEDDRADRRDARKSPCPALGCLEQTVDGFEESVGLAGLRPGHDAFHMRANHLGNVLHRLDLGAHHAGAPMIQHGPHHVDLLSIKDLAQLLFVRPRSRCSFDSHLGDQRIQVCYRLRLEPGGVLEQSPAHALQSLVGLLFDPAHLVHRLAGVTDDLELVKRDPSIGQMLRNTRDKAGDMSILVRVMFSGGQPWSCR